MQVIIMGYYHLLFPPLLSHQGMFVAILFSKHQFVSSLLYLSPAPLCFSWDVCLEDVVLLVTTRGG